MMKKCLTIAAGVVMATTAVAMHPSTQAQVPLPPAPKNCVYLREVSTGKTAIRQVIALNNSNANTDFAVPTGIRFSNYIAKFIPENNARYQVDVNLKYNDGSSSQVVSRTIEQARRFYLYNQPFRTPTGRQPFQINTRITGSRNNAYQVFVLACQ